jgi:hypothetical protein
MFRSVAAVGLVLALAGCVVRENGREHPHGGPPGQQRKAAQAHDQAHDHDHVCVDACDHVWDGAAFVVVVGHRHGHACGHERSGGRWVVVRATHDDHPGHGRGRGKGHR